MQRTDEFWNGFLATADGGRGQLRSAERESSPGRTVSSTRDLLRRLYLRIAAVEGIEKNGDPGDLRDEDRDTNITGALFTGDTVDGAHNRLAILSRAFSLSALESDLLFVIAAPALDCEFEHLYLALQEYHCAAPTIHLARKLVRVKAGESDRLSDALTPDAPLLRWQLVSYADAPAGALYRPLLADPRIVRFLRGSDEPDPRLAMTLRLPDATADANMATGANAGAGDAHARHLAHLMLSETERGEIERVAEFCRTNPQAAFCIQITGPDGADNARIAAYLSGAQNRPLLELSWPELAPVTHFEAATTSGTKSEIFGAVMREALLFDACLLITTQSASAVGPDAPLEPDSTFSLSSLLRELLRLADQAVPRIFVATGTPRELPAFSHRIFINLNVANGNIGQRAAYWRRLLPEIDPAVAEHLASAFQFTSAQIEATARLARDRARVFADEPVPTADQLFACARLVSNRNLANLARQVPLRHTWRDLVLPEGAARQLREICGQVRYRATVLGDWDFGRGAAGSGGVTTLFCGPSGTGKTMAAGVLARELGLDLYRIDLSTVVSKYVGETEKNLARIFAEAETSNAILFFDEADALFGKRSEVKDAHDRYANIEVAYLLQRVEEFPGVTILATNLKQNLDGAFLRRIHFMVEFPFPKPAERERIWRVTFPPGAPRGADVDFAEIARRYDVSGGVIRNIALGAAYLAAEDGAAIQMKHIQRAAVREYQKLGKTVPR